MLAQLQSQLPALSSLIDPTYPFSSLVISVGRLISRILPLTNLLELAQSLLLWENTWRSSALVVAWIHLCLYTKEFLAVSFHVGLLGFMIYSWVRNKEGKPISWVIKDYGIPSIATLTGDVSVILSRVNRICNGIDYVMDILTWNHPLSEPLFKFSLMIWPIWASILVFVPASYLICLGGLIVLAWNSLPLRVLRDLWARGHGKQNLAKVVTMVLPENHQFREFLLVEMVSEKRMSTPREFEIYTEREEKTLVASSSNDTLTEHEPSATSANYEQMCYSNDWPMQEDYEFQDTDRTKMEYISETISPDKAPLGHNNTLITEIERNIDELSSPSPLITATIASNQVSALKNRYVKTDIHADIRIYEHERWWLGIGYVKQFLPNDPSPYQNVDDASVGYSSLEDVKVSINDHDDDAKERWRWDGNWKVVIDPSTDKEGWKYGTNHWASWKPKSNFRRVTRRRMWTRQAVLLQRTD